MPRYRDAMRFDFTNLSGLDFEELVHDLLEQEWKIALEIFKPGRDGGIDLRALTNDGSLIVQCKNYAGSSFSALKADLRKERQKLERLNPDRYVLVTSLPLSVGQTDEIAALLAPYLRTPDDLVGGKRLAAILERREDVVKRHHKLWLTSVAVLERVLHASEHEQTRSYVEGVARKIPLFVQTRAYGRALEALETGRIVIVSGQPGIGKSTLADMLLYAHISDGFTPAVIRGSLAEGRRLATGSEPVIFHFDDFLGATFLGDRPDFLGRREDSDLIAFADWVLADGRHRFVLTTRDHVLADALQRSEKLRHHGIADTRCVVTVRDFGRMQRARILYNHLYFSTLPAAYRDEMLRDDFFLQIVDAKQFNPRIVEWLSNERRLRGVPPETYQAHVTALLDNPHEIWRHAFDRELSQAARDILVARHSLGYSVFIDDLERQFHRLHARSITRTNQKSEIGAWRTAMKELDGSFLSLRDNEVDFINPSVRDFMSTVIDRDPAIALDLVGSAVRFGQLSSLWEGSAPGGPFPNVRPWLVAHQQEFAKACDDLLDTPSLRWFDEPDGRTGRYIDIDAGLRARDLLKMRTEMTSLHGTVGKSLEILSAELANGDIRLRDVVSIVELAYRERRFTASNEIAPLLETMASELDFAWAGDWHAIFEVRAVEGNMLDELVPGLDKAFADFRSHGFQRELDRCDDRDDYETLQYWLGRLAEVQAYDFSSEVDSVESALALWEQDANEEERADAPSSPGYLDDDGFDEDDLVSDDEVRVLFERLTEERG